MIITAGRSDIKLQLVVSLWEPNVSGIKIISLHCGAACLPHLGVQSISSSGGPRGCHVLPGDDEGAGGLHSVVSGESSPDVFGGLTQHLKAVVLPEVDPPLSVTVVQVSEQGCDHFEICGHLPQVLHLSWRLGERHKSIRVNLEQKTYSLLADEKFTDSKQCDPVESPVTPVKKKHPPPNSYLSMSEYDVWENLGSNNDDDATSHNCCWRMLKRSVWTQL